MKKDELIIRTREFPHRCIKLGLNLPENNLGNHFQRQLLRASTSVAAKYRAACLAQSRAAFVSKLSIVIEESDESLFWLEFIKDEKLIQTERIQNLIKEASDLTAIFIASRKTIQKKNIQ